RYLQLAGKTSREIIRTDILAKPKEISKAAKLKEKFFYETCAKHRLELTKGARQLIKKLKKNGYKIGLGTSSNKYKVKFVLSKLGMSKTFDTVVTSNDIRKGKPDPEIYLLTAKKLKASECIVFEDAPLGVEAAKRAGMKCVALTTTHKRRDLKKADRIIRDFTSPWLSKYLEKHN
ncbi:MAG: HAD family phosphatase, partial [Candidatus Woesearchaeota archaeon]